MSDIPPWLYCIGIGEDGWDGLSMAARSLVESAEIVMGGERHLGFLPDLPEIQRIVWTSPFGENLQLIETFRGRRICVLASGDPMWFGVGATLARRVPAAEMVVIPHAGAFSLAAARLGWPLQDVRCLTVHGRKLETLAADCIPGAKLLVLAENGQSPAEVAAYLDERGCGASPVTVFEHLGGPGETRRDGMARDWRQTCADLNIIAVEIRAEAGAALWPRLPGLPDDAFRHDGQLTKREIRAATLALLAPLPGQMLWDLGAGCGSVAIEWMRAGGQAVAVEKIAARVSLIAANAAALGVPGLGIERGDAADALTSLSGAPDAIFIGGGVSQPGLLEHAWARLKPGGRLVANAVTIEGETALAAFRAQYGGDMTRLAVSRLGPVGTYHSWRPLMPVTMLAVIKPTRGRHGGRDD